MSELVHELAGLLKVTAWPLVALVALFILRQQIRSFLVKLGETLGRAGQISIGAKGLEIKYDAKIAAINSRVAALGAAQTQVTESVYKSKGTRRRRGAQGQAAVAIPLDLQVLVHAYTAVDDPDWHVRVSKKNDLALQMGDLVIEQRIDRDLLASETDEGFHLALAAAAVADPEIADLDRLLLLALTAKRLHVRYKIVVALVSLINKGLVQVSRVPAVREALHRMASGADDALNQLIRDAGALLDSLLTGDLVIGG